MAARFPAIPSRESANLNVLRAYAVLSIYIVHLLFTFNIYEVLGVKLFYIANTGVTIFFVHTCLVLMLSLERIQIPGWRLFAIFYVRRVFRIYPLSIFVVVLMFFAHIPVVPGGQYFWPGWETIISNITLTQNLTGSISVPAVLWTLPYEVEMYAVLPVICIFIRRFPSLWVPILLWLLAVIVLMANLKVRVVPYSAPCFLAGIIGYRLWSSPRMRLPFWVWPVAMVSCVALRVFAGMSGLNSAITLAPWLGCFLLGLAAPQFRDASSSWIRSLAAKLAQYSYGIYLSHFAVFWIAFVVMKPVPFWLQGLVCAALSVVLPLGLYHGVEKPMIDVGVRFARTVARKHGPVVAPARHPIAQPAEI